MSEKVAPSSWREEIESVPRGDSGATCPTPETILAWGRLLDLFRDRHRGPTTRKEVAPSQLAFMAESLLLALQEEPSSTPKEPAEDEGEAQPTDTQLAAWALLDVVRHPDVQMRLETQAEVEAWSDRIVRLIDASAFTVGQLVRQRVDRYRARTFLRTWGEDNRRSWSWLEVMHRIEAMARGIFALIGTEEGRVAILSENSVDVMAVDLACLSFGVVDVMIPTEATASSIAFMLDQSRPRCVFVSESQLGKILEHRASLDFIEHVIILRSRGRKEFLGLDDLVRVGRSFPKKRLEKLRDQIRSHDLATIMYTSGTTGTPKGIQFSQRNLVSKRFCRALALPEIGASDVFVCYLPLCHTFGRYLEMLGCLFWGATYHFLLDPTPTHMLDVMQKARPTVFISIPKKWIQIYQAIADSIDIENASDGEIMAKSRELVGGKLRWGLSAAGYLDPDIFRFFQRQGVELMSGFGMTEATGGITMTPPGEYREDSLGIALPGIELRLNSVDGELQVRGPYVMQGYIASQASAPGDDGTSISPDGWFSTGDVMEQDEEGHYRILDRKKEIYKNVKGQTIAPQKVENFFRDFDSVSRVFLVGDHREYNTALIVPARNEEEEPDKSSKEEREEQVYESYRTIVQTVNRFLAPFERIVDFALLDRDFELEKDELTPKGTYRRKIIEANFDSTIQALYERANLTLPKSNIEVRVSSRLLQELGLTANSLYVEKNEVRIRSTESRLVVDRVKKNKDGSIRLRVGSCIYEVKKPSLDLGLFLSVPKLWLGNEGLVQFIEIEPHKRNRWHGGMRGVKWRGRAIPLEDRECLEAPDTEEGQISIMDLHRASLALGSTEERDGIRATDKLDAILAAADGPIAENARSLLRRFSYSTLVPVRRRALEILIRRERVSRLTVTLRRFLDSDDVLLDRHVRDLLCESGLDDDRLQVLMEFASDACEVKIPDKRLESVASLLLFLANYGVGHPTKYEAMRFRLVRAAMFGSASKIREEARRSLGILEEGFRIWLGENLTIAVDPEMRKEYGWEDVVTVEEDVDPEDCRRLVEAITESSLIREAVFLFSGGEVVRLDDIPPGGVWISLLDTGHGKSAYRVIVQTRHGSSFEFAINLNRDNTPEQVNEECSWLVLLGEPKDGFQLAEKLGGYWATYDLWTEEFVAGDTLSRALRRLARQKTAEGLERLQLLWPHLAWTGLAAFVEFWHRTGEIWEIDCPGPEKLVVPIHDYQTNARLVSISARRKFKGLLSFVESLMHHFVKPVEARFESIQGLVNWDILFSSILEVLGEEEGTQRLRSMVKEKARKEPSKAIQAACQEFLDRVALQGFCPKRLHFAVERYRRWTALNPDAEPQACARTIQELYDTYGLAKLLDRYPEVRVRFFRETVFQDTDKALAEGLEGLVRDLRARQIESDEWVAAVSELRRYESVGPEQDYFLARLTFPHLRPEDDVDFVSSPEGGKHEADIVVALEDDRGEVYYVRRPLNPKEVGRLHSLFLDAKLDVNFGPDHRFLVAVNERQQIVGGLFYELRDRGATAHLEKIAVTDRYRKEGVSDGLMSEFFNRLRISDVKVVTTGFFRPEYFYRFGFAIERRYAGLVKTLS